MYKQTVSGWKTYLNPESSGHSKHSAVQLVQ